TASRSRRTSRRFAASSTSRKGSRATLRACRRLATPWSSTPPGSRLVRTHRNARTSRGRGATSPFFHARETADLNKLLTSGLHGPHLALIPSQHALSPGRTLWSRSGQPTTSDHGGHRHLPRSPIGVCISPPAGSTAPRPDGVGVHVLRLGGLPSHCAPPAS